MGHSMMHVNQYRTGAETMCKSVAHGFTFVEVMVVVSILAIMMVFATPWIKNVLVGNQLGSYANKLAVTAVTARNEAFNRSAGGSVTVCVSADGATCAGSGGWEQGWIVKQGATVIKSEPAAEAGIKMTETTSGLTSLLFDMSGVGSTQASIKVCRKTPSVGAQERVVTITATGKATVTRTTVGVCP
jgi:type IV fimbrial biogenesis protein FimT